MAEKIKLYRVADNGWGRPVLYEIEAIETPMQLRVPCCRATGGVTRLAHSVAERRGFRRTPEKALEAAVLEAEAAAESARKRVEQADVTLARVRGLAASDFRAEIVKAE